MTFAAMRRLPAAAALAAAFAFTLWAGDPAAAQAPSSSAGDWSGGLDLSLSPRLGKSLPWRADDSPVDESEGEVSLSASRTGATGLTNLKFRAGISSAPQLLDDSDTSSAIYAQVTLGDAFIPLPELIQRLRRSASASGGPGAGVPPDAVRPYASYRYTRAFSDFLQDHGRDDHQVTAGVRYRDIRSLVRRPDAAKPELGWYWEGRAEISRIWSTDESRTRLVPLARLDIYSPVRAGVRLFARLQGDLTRYDRLRAADGEERADKRVRATAGADLTALAARLSPAFSLELAAQYQRRWSNDPSASHTRGYFVPSVNIATRF